VTSAEASFTLVTGHVVPPLTHGGTAWGRDLTALRAASAAARASGPVVVLANINATPWHADFRTFSGSGLVDAADALGQGLRPTWPTWSPLALLPLDHALVGGGVAVDQVDTVVIAGTDHRALVVTLGVPRSTSSGKGG
jgi:endonuclease/exonuclease/phosphatase (EEP) superfamily protein YafD